MIFNAGRSKIKFKKLRAWNPLVAYLLQNCYIDRFVTKAELKQAFQKYLNMEKGGQMDMIFNAGWEILALDYKIDVFDIPKLWLVNPGVTPEMFFMIRRQFASSDKIYKREA